MGTNEAELNICQQITRIDHAIAETTKYVAEQRGLEAREGISTATSGSSSSSRYLTAGDLQVVSQWIALNETVILSHCWGCKIGDGL
jgi:hypothetical protein